MKLEIGQAAGLARTSAVRRLKRDTLKSCMTDAKDAGADEMLRIKAALMEAVIDSFVGKTPSEPTVGLRETCRMLSVVSASVARRASPAEA